ncbi:hypothetical protein BIFADO_00654 [Bifidobacterium adolescentis L2-32]|uniref:Uncharacterized protein n=1 Tax=Bifidobacterium adolescentis L2-32 TaxID=411481 RepID=A7A4A1_BIFAD|nr:hypothetical protein BIFADO_00654 [Bifidobacterium adolescentis L2-32]
MCLATHMPASTGHPAIATSQKRRIFNPTKHRNIRKIATSQHSQPPPPKKKRNTSQKTKAARLKPSSMPQSQ